MGYISSALVLFGIGGIIYHTLNLLKPRPKQGEFRAFGYRESGWAILVGILMIAAGVYLEFFYQGANPY